MRKLKVFGGTVFYNHEQVRMIVGATTKKRAIELVSKHTHITYNDFNRSWCQTGNAIEIELCTNSPETVFVQNKRHHAEAGYTAL